MGKPRYRKVTCQKKWQTGSIAPGLMLLTYMLCPSTHVLEKSLHSPSASSLATSGSKDIPSLLMGIVSPSHSKEKPTYSESQETKCSPGELLLARFSAPVWGTHHSHLGSLSLTLGSCSSTRWPRAMTISLSGSSPIIHMLA